MKRESRSTVGVISAQLFVCGQAIIPLTATASPQGKLDTPTKVQSMISKDNTDDKASDRVFQTF